MNYVQTESMTLANGENGMVVAGVKVDDTTRKDTGFADAVKREKNNLRSIKMTICQLLVADFKGILDTDWIKPEDTYDERNLKEAIEFCAYLMEEHGDDYFFSCGNMGGWYPKELKKWCETVLMQREAQKIIQESRIVCRAIIPKDAVMADTSGYYAVNNGELQRVDF
jgi:hypothetical protein